MAASDASAALHGLELNEERFVGRGSHSLTSELNLRTFGTHRSR